jgi:hypothetical protein
VVTQRSQDYAQLATDIARVVAEAQRLQLTQSALGALIRKEWE